VSYNQGASIRSLSYMFISMSFLRRRTVVTFLVLFSAITLLLYHATRLQPPPRYAFATLLAGPASDTNMSEPYFVAARMITYQLLHARETRSSRAIPLLIAVLPDCPMEKRDRLIRDGATVVEVEPIERDWVVPAFARWRHELAKLRFWQMTQYDKICFLDADMMLTAPLDGIFEEVETNLTPTLSNPDGIQPDEGRLPASYGFAAITQTWVEHDFPPTEDDFEDPGVMNVGFFVLIPSARLFDYYLSILDLPGRFQPDLPEQALLNYAHRLDGNLPWHRLKTSWNVMAPTLGDYYGGARTMHDKWWNPRNPEVYDLFNSIRWRMEGYFERMDELLWDHR
jgi:alpha-N-acetylglucosamine transferase